MLFAVKWLHERGENIIGFQLGTFEEKGLTRPYSSKFPLSHSTQNIGGNFKREPSQVAPCYLFSFTVHKVSDWQAIDLSRN